VCVRGFQEYLDEDAYKEVEDLAERLQAYKGNESYLFASF